jgi:hypothetical protein
MQDSAFFRGINNRTGKHGFGLGGKLGPIGQIDQQGQGFIGNQVFGEIEQQIVKCYGKLVEALFILIERILHAKFAGNLAVMLLNGIPFGRVY